MTPCVGAMTHLELSEGCIDKLKGMKSCIFPQHGMAKGRQDATRLGTAAEVM
jgi:hypothetical protein